MIPLWLIKPLIGLAVVAGLYFAWQWDRHKQFQAGKAELAAEMQAQAEKDIAERTARAADAQFKYSERASAQEKIDAKRRSVAVARAAELDSVRDELRSIQSAASAPATGNCERTDRIRAVLSEGAGLLAEGVGLVEEGQSLGEEGEGHIERGESLILLCREFDAALRLQD